eukprot:TRINITY_DN69714_c0_g1_i2.p1 TRINITY_DN69714_c0_g1~~TRINITY_DN69714_c0_g1_i2.p1  ORF type:complete len:667 (+),score=141.32 TRINITY_DN69714_c0_g1_i2:67-2067(+)
MAVEPDDDALGDDDATDSSGRDDVPRAARQYLQPSLDGERLAAWRIAKEASAGQSSRSSGSCRARLLGAASALAAVAEPSRRGATTLDEMFALPPVSEEPHCRGMAPLTVCVKNAALRAVPTGDLHSDGGGSASSSSVADAASPTAAPRAGWVDRELRIPWQDDAADLMTWRNASPATLWTWNRDAQSSALLRSAAAGTACKKETVEPGFRDVFRSELAEFGGQALRNVVVDAHERIVTEGGVHVEPSLWNAWSKMRPSLRLLWQGWHEFFSNGLGSCAEWERSCLDLAAQSQSARRALAARCAAIFAKNFCDEDDVPMRVYTAPAVPVFYIKYCRYFVHWMSLGLPRVLASLPLLRGDPTAKLLVFGLSGAEQDVSLPYVHETLKLLGVADRMEPIHNCRLLFLRQAWLFGHIADRWRSTYDGSSQHRGPPRPIIFSFVDTVERLPMQAVRDAIREASARARSSAKDMRDGRTTMGIGRCSDIAVLQRARQKLLASKVSGTESGGRSFSNAQAMCETIRDTLGSCAIMRNEGTPIWQQVFRFARLRMVLGMTGSGMVNTVFMAPGSLVLEVAPARHHMFKAAKSTWLPLSTCGVTWYSMLSSNVGLQHHTLLLPGDYDEDSQSLEVPLALLQDVLKHVGSSLPAAASPRSAPADDIECPDDEIDR